MRMKRTVLDPVDQTSPHTLNEVNEELTGAVKVHTESRPYPDGGGGHTIIIYAFYPDEEMIDTREELEDIRVGSAYDKLLKKSNKLKAAVVIYMAGQVGSKDPEFRKLMRVLEEMR